MIQSPRVAGFAFKDDASVVDAIGAAPLELDLCGTDAGACLGSQECSAVNDVARAGNGLPIAPARGAWPVELWVLDFCLELIVQCFGIAGQDFRPANLKLISAESRDLIGGPCVKRHCCP